MILVTQPTLVDRQLPTARKIETVAIEPIVSRRRKLKIIQPAWLNFFAFRCDVVLLHKSHDAAPSPQEEKAKPIKRRPPGSGFDMQFRRVHHCCSILDDDSARTRKRPLEALYFHRDVKMSPRQRMLDEQENQPEIHQERIGNPRLSDPFSNKTRVNVGEARAIPIDRGGVETPDRFRRIEM